MAALANRRSIVVTVLVAGAVVALALLFLRESVPAPEIDAASVEKVARPEAPAEELATAPSAETKAVEPRTSAPVETQSSPASSGSVRTIVFGALLDDGGKRIDGARSAWVTLVDADGRRRSADAHETGAYALPDVPFGRHLAVAGAHGYLQVEETIELTSARPVMERDFTLARATTLRVRATTPDGKPLHVALTEANAPNAVHDLLAVATADPPGATIREVTGSKNNPFGVGQFWETAPSGEPLPKEYVGVLVLMREPPVFASLVLYQHVLATKKVEPGADEVAFTLSVEDVTRALGRVHARVLDAATSAPLQGARAQLSGPSSLVFSNETSDAQGELVVADREPGRFVMRLVKPGYEQLRREIELLPGATTDLGEIALEPALHVRGRTIDADGKPVSATLALGTIDAATGKVDFVREQSFRSSADGAFAIDNLGRRQYVLRAGELDAMNDSERETVWVSSTVVADTRAGSIETLELRLVRAVPLVLAVANGPADGLRFRIAGEDGKTLIAGRFWGSGPRPLRLPPGRWRVELLDADERVLAEQSVELARDRVRVVLAR